MPLRRLLVLAVLLVAGSLPAPVRGQTALVLEGEEGAEAAARIQALAGEVRWAFGPVRVETRRDRETAGIESGGTERGGSETTVIVVPVVTGEVGEAGSAGAEPAAAPIPDPRSRLRTVPVRWTDGAGVGDVARLVERRAGAALSALVEGGRLEMPDVPGPVYPLRGLNVTAIREAREVFTTPFPVAVLGGSERAVTLLTAPADLFREVPGLDVDGVGGQQRRPVIRGLQGQRVLLLADGLRLNNPRRRVDSGEPLDMVGPGELERIEVVRGPASVLYGSDAIGGVINLVTRDPPPSRGDVDLGGVFRTGWSSAGNARAGSGAVTGTAGPVSFRLAGGYRAAGSYEAPAGEFGDVSFPEAVRVGDTGVRDRGGSVAVEVRPATGHELYARYRGSVASDAGFGYVDPNHFGEGLPTVRILFPRQEFGRQVVGYRGIDLGLAVADRLELAAYRQTNDRVFVTDVHVPLGSPLPPSSFATVETRSLTDLTSDGFRAEARKLVGDDVVLTYGVDLHRDRSRNTDTSTSMTVIGGGEPRISADATSPVPEARMRSVGAFAQARARLWDRADLVLGGRYQDVRARALETPPTDGGTATDRTLVGSANLFLRPADGVGVVVSVGRGFRSPNLVERFYTGPTPEGRGIWVRNPDLGAETSLSVDVGVRYRGERLEAEVFAFRNRIRDGIRLQATGDTVDGAAVHRNVNVDQLGLVGVEATVTADLGRGLSAAAGYARIDGKNRLEPGEEVTESYGRKLTASLRYRDPSGRFHAEYGLRSQGERDDLVLGGSVVGETIPGFTTHALRGGVALPGGHGLTVSVENLTDELYAEALNVGFFRPEPGRHFEVGWTVTF